MYLYLMEVETDGFFAIKIGISKNVEYRIAQLQTGCPLEIKCSVWFLMSDNEARWIEGILHDLFRESRTHGEWFSVMPEEIIKKIFQLVEAHDIDCKTIVDGGCSKNRVKYIKSVMGNFEMENSNSEQKRFLDNMDSILEC